jgi:hypothetical protein
MNIHDLVDLFVHEVDPSETQFRRIESAPWIDTVETALRRRFPVSFHSLVTRYAFPAFDAGGIHFFANTGHDSLDELKVAIFKDPNIANVTRTAGYIQFARPEGGSYDPICFDARRSANNREYPIVRLNHEDILCRNEAGSPAKIANSFYRFITDFSGCE